MMRKWIGWVLILAAVGGGIPAFAVDRMAVIYVNGTVKAVGEEVDATLDTSSARALELSSGSEKVSIPYEAVTAYEYRVENRFRLGVLGTIAVSMIKARSKRHLVTLSWKDEAGTFETATFEASRDRARGLIKVLDVRAPQVCAAGHRNVNW